MWTNGILCIKEKRHYSLCNCDALFILSFSGWTDKRKTKTLKKFHREWHKDDNKIKKTIVKTLSQAKQYANKHEAYFYFITNDFKLK